MIKLKRRIWFWLLVAAISSFISGCGGGSSSGSDGGSTTVTVSNYSGIRIPNATVVLGDSNGAMKTYGVTDANGQITFTNSPADSTVTAATSCLQSGSTTTTYSIDVQYDVNGSAILTLDNCSGPSAINPGSAAELGTVTVNVTDMPGEVVKNQITIGRHVFVDIGGLITSQTVTITPYDLDSDGTFSVIVIGKDLNGGPVAYGFQLDQAFTNGMTLNVAMEPMSFVQSQIANIPTTAASFYHSISLSRNGKQGVSLGRSYSLLSAPSSTIINVPYIPGFGSGVRYRLDVGLDQNRDGTVDSRQSLNIDALGDTPSDHAFDLNKALTAPCLTVTDADTVRPILSWSGIDPAASYIYFSAHMRSSVTDLHLGFSDLIRSRTSIRYPELPDSLAMLRPNKVQYFSVFTAATEGNIHKYSSGAYQAPNP